MSVLSFLDWFTGGSENPYMSLYHCMAHDTLWVAITVTLDLAVAAGYGVIAVHWWKNQRHLPPIPAKRALNTLRNIFVFCGICGYAFIPIKMFWPAWRLYDIFMAALVYFTWKYAWSARDLKVVYTELGRSATLAAELEESKQESRQKSTFLNALSHDLRTPLNGLMLQANLAELSLAGKDTESLKSAVTEIKSSAKATADLLDSLLECARADWSQQQHSVADFSLTEVIENVANSSQATANERGIYFKHSCSPGLTIRSDRLKLERILANLTSNALKFTSKGGIRIDVQQSGRGIEIHVVDTGVGIPLEHRERIFEEFYQIHNEHRDRSKGFGLGLSIARRLARQLGGDITVDTSPDAGSRFSVVLPNVLEALTRYHGQGSDSTNSSSPQEQAQGPSPSAPASSPTVLIVEDDLVSRSALQSIFRLRGMRVEVAGTVAHGIQILNASSPQYLILDLMLPDGDGAKLMHEIRTRGLDTTVAITTAISDPDRLKSVRQLDPAVLIRKPIDLVQLLRGLKLTP